MLEDVWDAVLELIARFVIPDWGAVVALLPVFVLILIAMVLARTFLGLFRAAPARRGKCRMTPRTPAEIHMPGPSMAPFLAAIGAALLFLGLVFPGPLLIVGGIALGLALLYWLGEALRIYDRDVTETGASAESLPAVIHRGPPPGVHMPGPSFRPFLGAVGVAMLMLGLVFEGWLLAIGVIVLVITLVGWLVDARKEYVQAVEADTTGHLENIPAPRTPTLLLSAIAVMLVFGVMLQVGWLPPTGVSGGTAPGASGGPPSGSPGPGGSAPPAGSGGPPASAPAADVTLVAQNVAFDQSSISGPADKAFKLALVNDDQGTPHNVAFKDASGAEVWKGETFPGVATTVYDVPALPAGSYTFLCTVHPTMTGSATLQ